MGASADMVNATCKQLKDETRPAHGNFISLGLRNVSSLLESSKAQSIRMEVLLLLTYVAYLLVATLGSQRRRSRNWFIQKGLLVAHTMSFPLGAYVLGSMQSKSNSTGQSSLYLIGAVALFNLHVCTNSSYTLGDIKQATKFQYRWLFYLAYGMFLLNTLGTTGNSFLPVLVFPLYIIAQYKLMFIHEPYVLASHTWNLNKTVADYMYDEHTKGEFVPATMEGCHYLVDWPPSRSKLNAPSYATQLTAYEDEVIDIERIWLCSDMLLNQELKDTCLSFSLFHLLRRRFFGFTCGESKERAHDFVFKGLLLENGEGAIDCNRVFRVIETELAFMYDFFFTKSAGIYYGSRAATILSLLSATFLSFIILWAVMSRKSMKNTDTVISLLILVSAALLELLQLLLHWTSIWSRVSFVCQYLRGQARLNTWGSCCSCSSSSGCCCSGMLIRLNEFLAKIGVHCAPHKHYWQHRLGQYSLLDYKPTLRCKLIGCDDAAPGDQLAKGILDPVNNCKRRNCAKAIEVPGQVKKALIYSLKRTNGELMNGKSSLASNGVGHLLWACALKVQSSSDTSGIILTWHIATWYCEMGTSRCGPSLDEGTQLKIHHGVATKLSKHCAYLVVHAPKLLPGHHYDTGRVFDAVAVETCEFLLPSMMRDRYEALKNYGLEESGATIFQSGAKLGRQLEEMEDVTRRWKVLADFWCEMMLYVAPSDNVSEHFEQLTRGGELITHLWALLSHAGILERAPDQQPPPGRHPRAENTCESHQEIEQDSASHEGTTHHSGTISPADHLAAASPAHHLAGNLQMSDFARQAPSPQVVLQAASLPLIPTTSEISAANECRIDVPEASSSTQRSPPQAGASGSLHGKEL